MREEMLAVQKRHEDAQCVHGGAYSVDRDLVRLDFSSSVSPLGAPPAAIEAIRKRAGELASEYPDPQCKQLRASLCKYLGGVNEDQLCIGNGAIELIHWFAQTFVRGKVLVPAPTFCEYELASRRTGAVVVPVPLERTSDGSFELDPEAILSAARGASALFLCNPNNPTGQTLPPKDIERILSELPGTMVLLDECFIELSSRPQVSFSGRTGEFANLVVLRSMTKSFALAGLRLGYSISNVKTAERLDAKRIHWNVNGLAQAAGVAALQSARKYLASARALISRERSYMRKIFESGGLGSYHPMPSEANFFLVGLSPVHSSGSKFRDRLLKKTGVLVRDCSTFAGMGDGYIRVAVKSHEQNVELLKSLRKMEHGADG
ncbi:MAG: histidinol-phosphate transaminase [Nitrososphaera sp.]